VDESGERSIVGHEALSRWGNIPPIAYFTPILFDRLAFRLSLYNATVIARDLANYPDLLAVSINLSPREIAEDGHLWFLIRAFRHFRERVTFEFTEDALLTEAAIVNAHRLKGAGFRVAVDDFGKAYNSRVADFLDLPIDGIKIDGSLTRRCDRLAYRCYLARMVAFFQDDMGLIVTAEGIEFEWQLDILRSIGVRHYQGWLFGKPEPPEVLFEDK
jgi:EAL domain-containing protein (putative c-di-GMP-specific phosphodiesterase class I)